MTVAALSFHRDGAAHHPAALSSEAVAVLCARLDAMIGERPGRRLAADELAALDLAGLADIASLSLGRAAFPVRAVLFDKTREANWIVAWHQDRTIPVRSRMDVDGFGPWSTKAGLLHVSPPIAVLEGMATLRLHLDDCDDDNAPLLIALGSHRLGYVQAEQADARAATLPQYACHARAGDVWAYATPILHASQRSRSTRRRRVLQIDYAAEALPGGLKWLF